MPEDKPLDAFKVASPDSGIRDSLKKLLGIQPVNDTEWAEASGSVTKWADSDNVAYAVKMVSSCSGNAGWMKLEGDTISILEMAEHQYIVKPHSFLLWNPQKKSHSIVHQSGDILVERRADYQIRAIVSSLVDGKTLSGQIRSEEKCTGVQLALDVSSDIVEALEYLHKKGIDCPDLKLGNIIYQNKYKLICSGPEPSHSVFLGEAYDKYAYPLSFGLLLLNLATGHDPYNYPIHAKDDIEKAGRQFKRFVSSPWVGKEQYLKGLYPEKVKESPELFELIYKLMEMSDEGCNLIQANMRLHKIKNSEQIESSGQKTYGITWFQ
ncbi:hypothetical protein [Endozoicomonas sp.]|uniref:hypothetical protein n=1 Tax=Endozoicomonas sp. TaxID=1892382 RepID=UPI003839E53A